MGDSRFDIRPFLDQKEGQHFERKSMLHGAAGRKRSRNRKTVREEAAAYVADCDVPVQMHGSGFPLRVGDQTIQAKESRIAETKRQGMYESWENRSSPCSLADLDADLLAQARRQAGLASLTNEDYLLKRKLADRHGARIVLRRAAELLFARGEPDHPNSGIRVFRVIGTERRTGISHNVEELPRIEGNLPTVFAAAQDVVRGLLRRPSRLLGARFHEVSEYPDFAWREAILNAVLRTVTTGSRAWASRCGCLRTAWKWSVPGHCRRASRSRTCCGWSGCT